MQCAVCSPHGLAAGMGLCGAGCGFAGQCFAVWQQHLPPAGVAAGVECGSFSRMDALLLLLWLRCAVYRAAMLCAAIRLLWQQPEAEVQP